MQSHIARNEIKSITNLLAYSDGNEYFSLTADKDLASKEELILEFYPPQKNELGLVINFRQTLLTTFLLYSGISYMGDQVGDYFFQKFLFLVPSCFSFALQLFEVVSLRPDGVLVLD